MNPTKGPRAGFIPHRRKGNYDELCHREACEVPLKRWICVAAWSVAALLDTTRRRLLDYKRIDR
jgi:hypothetical protein